jgi:hypothetical protein
MIRCLMWAPVLLLQGLRRLFSRRGHVRSVVDWKTRDTALGMAFFYVTRRKQTEEVRALLVKRLDSLCRKLIFTSYNFRNVGLNVSR